VEADDTIGRMRRRHGGGRRRVNHEELKHNSRGRRAFRRSIFIVFKAVREKRREVCWFLVGTFLGDCLGLRKMMLDDWFPFLFFGLD